MKALLYKDALVLWKQMKYMLLLVALFCLMPNQAFGLNRFFIVYAGLLFPMSLMAYDERAKWDNFAPMLPYSTRSLVLSHYVFGWCSALFGVGMNLIGLALFPRKVDSLQQELVTLGWILALILVMQALSFPYFFRVGVEKGRMYATVFCVILLVLGAGLAALLGQVFPQAAGALTLGAPAALLLSLLLCLASVPVAQRQYLRRAG